MINLRTEFKWAHIHSNRLKTKLYRMPSLTIKQVEAIVKETKRGNRSYNLRVMEPDAAEIKMGEQVFYGYPLEHSGEVEAILTRGEFKFVDKFDPINYGSNDRDLEKALSVTNLKQGSKKNAFQFIL